MLDILVVGYYGVLNAGDDLLQQSLTWIFREHRLTFSRNLPSLDIVHSFDLLIIGGGSIWPGYSIFHFGNQYARDLRIPFIIAGVSAAKHDPLITSPTKSLIEKALYFHVRDTSTAEYLSHPKIQVGTDLFWSMPWYGDKTKLVSENKYIALNIRGDSLKRWPLATFITAETDSFDWLGWPFFFGEPTHDRGGINDYDALRTLDLTTPASFSFLPLFLSSSAVVMRYHGLVSAVRAGKPVLALSAEKKLLDFCSDNHLQDLVVDTPDDFQEKFSFLGNNYRSIETRLAETRNSMLSIGATQCAQLRSIVSNVKKRKYSRTRKLLIDYFRSALGKIT